jgi:hypothetical protein
MPVTLEYATTSPSATVRMARFDHGISIRFRRSFWRAALHVIGDFAEGGLEGLLVLILAPLLIVGAGYVALFWGSVRQRWRFSSSAWA